jgi:hypothetical protein
MGECLLFRPVPHAFAVVPFCYLVSRAGHLAMSPIGEMGWRGVNRWRVMTLWAPRHLAKVFEE